MASKVIGTGPIGENNSKSFLSDDGGFNSPTSPCRMDGLEHKDVIIPKSAEYVKRTARLFEKARITNDEEPEQKCSETYTSFVKIGNGETAEDPRDVTDFSKKPSYLGVSCSNSGYRNVIKYDSKLREGLWSSTNQRESLVLSNHRLRDSSPLKFDNDSIRSYNGHVSYQPKNNQLSGERGENLNGLGQTCYRMEEFVNISTSTKTISTFRNTKAREEINTESKETNDKVNGQSEEIWRKSSGYSSLGISPKILKSPEKNCNSFLRSINSFERNCKKNQNEIVKSSHYRKIKTENVTYSPSNSIQQRIERLYGPGALAQGFYVHNSSPRARLKSEIYDETAPNSRLSESISQNIKSSIESIPDLLPAAPEVVLPIEKCTNGEGLNGSLEDENVSDEKNGRYFLKLLQKEIDKLESLASFAEAELENGENLPEEVSGKLRAAAGKARLLVRQKLHQFEGLCQKNLNEKPGEQFPTTSEDLAGFWDMVMLQVVQVYSVFDEIEKLKKNNWKTVIPKEERKDAELITTPDSGKKTVRKSPASSKNSEKNEKAEMAKKAREETRKKMMEERRKKMKELRENKTVNDNEIEIFAK